MLCRIRKTYLRRLDEVDTEYLRNVLQSTHWRVRGQGGAAEVLGLKPTTFEAKMKKLGIHRRDWPPVIGETTKFCSLMTLR